MLILVDLELYPVLEIQIYYPEVNKKRTQLSVSVVDWCLQNLSTECQANSLDCGKEIFLPRPSSPYSIICLCKITGLHTCTCMRPDMTYGLWLKQTLLG
jgi:hypothetical protein